MIEPFIPTPEQKAILQIASGRHIVLAPPGSGKTKLLAHRVIEALKAGMPPSTMVCLTFTNRAARTMQDRVGKVPPGLRIGNFHSFAYAFLKKVGVFRAQSCILDEEDSDALVNLALDSLFPVNAQTSDNNPGDPLLGVIENNLDPALVEAMGMRRTGGPAEQRPPQWVGRTKLKERLRELIHSYINFVFSRQEKLPKSAFQQDYTALRCGMGFGEEAPAQPRPLIWGAGLILGGLKMFADKYRDLKSETRAMDFDDLLLETLKWLHRNPDSEYCHSYRWVQVDEAQDLNDTQWEILKRIVHPKACLVVYADPLQAIYSFMGAHPETLERNRAELGLKPIGLDLNHRSPQYLIDLYTAYACRNIGYSLQWRAKNTTAQKSDNIVYIETESDEIESRYLAQHLIPKSLRDGANKIAVLARTNAQVGNYSGELEKQGIDHFLIAQYDLFRLRIAKDFMAFLEALASPVARLPWLRILAASDAHLSLRKSLDLINQCYSCGILPHWFLKGPGMEGYYPPVEMTDLAMRHRLVVLDTETTGTDTASCDIIQFAAVEIVSGRIGQSINLYLRTDQELGESENIHHISGEFLANNGMDRAEAFKRILDFIGDSPIAAHNMEFDLGMLEANIGRTLNMSFLEGRVAYCTLEVALALDPDSPSHKLEHLIERYGLQGKNTHSALDDVMATAELVLHYRKAAGEKYEAARAFFAAHYKTIARVEGVFGPTWRKLRSDVCGKVSFLGLFQEFRGLRLSTDYHSQHLALINRKLLRHMQENTHAAPLRLLLETELKKYLLYREPDLITEHDRLVVSTVHRAKGLEFDVVIIGACHSNNFPSYFAQQDKSGKQKKESARLLFVALTRAKKTLVILQPHEYTTNNGRKMTVQVSPFLKDLLPYFTRGETIRAADLESPPANADDLCDDSMSHLPEEGHEAVFTCPECGETWQSDGQGLGLNCCPQCGELYDPNRGNGR